MSSLFPIPIIIFIKIIAKNGGVSLRGIRNLPAWLIKTIVFEPFRWVELLFNSKIRRHQIEKDPIFILGFYRSGTSFTHEFLSQDHRFGYHTNYQMILPEIMISTEWFLAPFLDFICRLFKIQDPVHRIRMSFKYPGEEDGTMTTGLNPRGAQWGYFFPRIMMKHFRKYVLFENLDDKESKAWTDDMLFLHKKISFINKGKQLILKSPPNTARIKLLLANYPNAKFIFIHRNPYDVYASNKRFWKVTHRIYALGEFKDVDINRIIFETYSSMMDRYLEEKTLIPDGNLVELSFDEMMKSPLETMENVYKSLKLEDFDVIKNKIKDYLRKQKSFIRLKHELPIVEKTLVKEKLMPYIKHWNY
ncbi:sulfotransferase family protein [Tamlana flava]|uniref:sulfotransferase family protein n=1 Tax=Tamlana flava TaxID=3158572 RepID=UPI00351BC96B